MFDQQQEEMLHCPPPSWKPMAEIAASCPRCASPNTKFCYYNNYSLSQPRYFCKGCRRYWTKGGSLRNVPVGGGCRKNRRPKAIPGRLIPPPNYPPAPSSLPGTTTPPPPDIDLALVFAKFLNHNEPDPDLGGSALSDQIGAAGNLLLGTLNSDVPQEEMAMGSTSSDPMGEVPHQLQLIHTQTQLFDGGEKQIEDYFSSHNDGSGYGPPTTLPTDEAAQEIIWSDAQQNFSWHPQEFEPFPSNDHSKISANLLGEFWTSFDHSGCEIFTRP